MEPLVTPTKASDITEDQTQGIEKDREKVKIKKDSLLMSGDGFFKTIQGEGATMGLPCVFARLHRCNLKCSFCDAFYTWKEESKEFWLEPRRLSFQEAEERIRKEWDFGGGTPRVVWTGGEPLMQRNQVTKMATDYLSEWEHEIETNGTLMPTSYMLENFQFNCSPKLSNNEADREGRRIKPKILAALNEANTLYKFVCEKNEDLDEIERDYGPYVDRDKIVIMPEGVTSDQIDIHMHIIHDECMKRGFRLLGRMQAQFANGAERGV